jgi:hypothetical protein
LVALISICACLSARAAILAHWTEFGEEGLAEARVVTDDPACPSIFLDGAANTMTERAAPNDDFPIRICAAALPPGVGDARVGGEALPIPAVAPKRIVVLGDTGCRIQLIWHQACNDPNAWPFAGNAASAASLKPDLVIHVGDYLYRESPCPPDVAQCAGSPYGDKWAAWKADLFDPAAPLLAAAPWIVVRGNHEACARAGKGWRRLLAPGGYDPATPCVKHEPPYAGQIGERNVIVFDSAIAPDQSNNPAIAAIYRGDFETIARLASRPSWLVTHRPIWGIAAIVGARVFGGNFTLVAASEGHLPDAIELQIAGHIHTLEVINFSSGQPPLVIAGNGGDDLWGGAPKEMGELEIAGATVADGFSLGGLGFLLFERDGDSWNMTIYGRDTQLKRRCEVRDRRIACVDG